MEIRQAADRPIHLFYVPRARCLGEHYQSPGKFAGSNTVNVLP
jgi:hypothetical protein